MTIDDLQRRRQLLSKLEAKLLCGSKPDEVVVAETIEKKLVAVLEESTPSN